MHRRLVETGEPQAAKRRGWDGEWPDVAGAVAVGCAVFLLFAPLGGRTTWEPLRGNGSSTDAGGYNAISVLLGIVAFVALGVACWLRPRPVLPLFGAAVAIAAFALTAYATGVFVVARLQGGIFVYACWCFEEWPNRAIVTPAPGPPFFLLASLIGIVSTLALAVSWVRQPDGETTASVWASRPRSNGS